MSIQQGQQQEDLVNNHVSENMDEMYKMKQHRKIRVLVISQGGARQEAITEMLQAVGGFDVPVFSPGVDRRALRNRCKFLQICHQAGLIPYNEWEYLCPLIHTGLSLDEPQPQPRDRQQLPEQQQQQQQQQPPPGTDPNKFFEALRTHVPLPQQQHHASGKTVTAGLHYSEELWRKAKTLTRERSVLACVLAHLIAMRTFVQPRNSNSGVDSDSPATAADDDDGDDSSSFDVLLEDNVRTPCNEEAVRRIRQTIHAAKAASCQTEQSQIHLVYFGWLGSICNLQWTFASHLPRRALVHGVGVGGDGHALAPWPTPQHIEQDLASGTYVVDHESTNNNDSDDTKGHVDMAGTASVSFCTNQQTQHERKRHTKPGGTPAWGAYAYWVSQPAYEHLMHVLRTDIGALLWKPKRAKQYRVKPIDKILPRQTLAGLGRGNSNNNSDTDNAVVMIATQPAFFRAPMLSSHIHTKWDAEFCISTTYQLQQTQLDWSDLWLTEAERQVVQRYQTTGQWISPTTPEGKQELEDMDNTGQCITLTTLAIN